MRNLADTVLISALYDYLALAAYQSRIKRLDQIEADYDPKDWWAIDPKSRAAWRIAAATMAKLVSSYGAKLATDRPRALGMIAAAGYEAYRAALEAKDNGKALDSWPTSNGQDPAPAWVVGWLAVAEYLAEALID